MKLTITFTMQKEVVFALKIRLDQTSCNVDVYWTVMLHDQSCSVAYTLCTVRTNCFDTHTHTYIYIYAYTYIHNVCCDQKQGCNWYYGSMFL